MSPWVGVVVLILVGSAMMLGLVRMILGPTTADRIVVADTLAVISTALVMLLALWFESALYLDLGLLFGALAFVGVVALARAIEAESGSEER